MNYRSPLNSLEKRYERDWNEREYKQRKRKRIKDLFGRGRSDATPLRHRDRYAEDEEKEVRRAYSEYNLDKRSDKSCVSTEKRHQSKADYIDKHSRNGKKISGRQAH